MGPCHVPPLGDSFAAGVTFQGPLWLEELYAVELSFSHCPSYRQLLSVRIPFLQSPLDAPRGNAQKSSFGDLQGFERALLPEEERKLVAVAADNSFPFSYEIVLK